MRILLTGTRAPATLDLARRLTAAGATVIGADSMRFPLARYSRALAAHHPLPSPRNNLAAYHDALARLIENERIDLLWPTCEEVFHVAAGHARLSALTRVFFPSLEVLLGLHDKLAFALSSGDFAPPSWEAELAPAGKNLVYKPRYSRFATRTRFGKPPDDPSGWMAQEFVEGQEFSSWAIAVEGQVRVLTFYASLLRSGRGAGCAFSPHWDEEAAGFIRDRVAATGFTGSIAFDFIRSKDGPIKVIECNPRMTSGIHVLAPSVDVLALLESPAPSPPPMRPAQLFLPVLASSPRVGDWRADVVLDKSDRWPAVGQFLTILEFSFQALRHRCSLLEATTRDIEFNG